MPQGPRGGWLRAVCTGLGAVLCAGAIGCNGLDKDKDAKLPTTGKQVGPGLPGTPTLPGSPGTGMGMGTPKTGQPAFNSPYAGAGMGAGAQPAGGFNSMPANNRNYGSPGFPAGGTVNPAGGAYNNVVPNVGPAGGFGAGAPTGAGAGYAMPVDTGYGRGSPPAPDFGAPLGPVPPQAPAYGSGAGAGVVPNVGPMAPTR